MSKHTHTDKIFAATACLSETELRAYCRGRLDTREQHRLERHLTDCALCSAAVAAFAAAPAALDDVPGLKRTLASKIGKGAIGLGTTVIGAFAVVGLVVAGVAVKQAFWPAEEVNNAAPPAVIRQSPETSAPVLAENKPGLEEFFIRPGAPVHETNTPSPAVSPIDTQMKEKVEITPLEVIPAKPLQPIAAGDTSSARHEEAETGQEYNSPVVYIRDLKITDFEKYYRKPLSLQAQHLSARYHDMDSRRADFAERAATTRTVTADEVLDDALNYFNQGRYGKSISQFDLLLNHNSKDLNALFYVAVCEVRLELYDRAIPLLDKVLASSNNVFHQEAEWYKALALIGQGNMDEAKLLLQEIASKKGFYKKQAEEKLATLK